MKNNNWLSKGIWVMTFLIAIVLSFKSFREPDVWWMFRVGDWMIENGKIPTKDMLSFTHEGVDWISVKWLFEVLAFWCAKFVGPEFVVILQTIVNVLLLVFLRKAYKSLAPQFGLNQTNTFSAGFLITTLVFLFGMDFRMISRPEMSSHILTLIFFSTLLKYRHTKGKFIFGLIGLQILWVNIHEAYGTGMVILGTFLGAEVVEWWFQKEKRKIDVQLLLALGGGILATAINPRGLYMLIHPYVIFTQVGSNHYTSELNSAFYKSDYYFGFKDPWIMLGLIAIIIVGLIWWLKFNKNIKKLVLNQLGIGYLISLILFLYLGLTGHRNVPFPIIVSAPLVAVLLDVFLEKLNTKFKPYLFSGIAIISVAFYLNIVAGNHYKWFTPQDRYGLRVYAEKNPVGAAQFVKDHSLEGQGFSDYLTSAYFLWELRPDFKSFIDLRDLDIFPMEFFHEFAAITYYPEKFKAVDDQYNFNYVLLYRPQFAPLHQYLYQSPDWELVYADPVANVYLKNNDQNASLIEQFGVSRHPEGVFSYPPQPKPAGISTFLSTVFNPLYDANEKDEYDINQIAGEYYASVGDINKAVQYTQQLIEGNNSIHGYASLGNMYMKFAEKMASDPTYQQQLIISASKAFKAGYAIDKKNYGCLMGQGWVATMSNQYKSGLRWLNKAHEIDDSEAIVYQLRAICHNALVTKERGKADEHIQAWFTNMKKAHEIDPNNQQIILQLIAGHCQRSECEETRKYLKVFNREPWMPQIDLETIENCRNKCN